MTEAIETPSYSLEDTYNYNISEYDIALHPKVDGCPSKLDKKTQARVLWDMGMDTKGHKFTSVRQLHRTLQGQAKDGLIFCGRERSDKGWLKSGCATLTGHIESIWDESLKQDLRRLSR